MIWHGPVFKELKNSVYVSVCACVCVCLLSCTGKDSGETGNTGYLWGERAEGVGLKDKVKGQLFTEYCSIWLAPTYIMFLNHMNILPILK